MWGSFCPRCPKSHPWVTWVAYLFEASAPASRVLTIRDARRIRGMQARGLVTRWIVPLATKQPAIGPTTASHVEPSSLELVFQIAG